MKDTAAARPTLRQLLNNSGVNPRLRARAQVLLERMKTDGETR